MKTNSVLQRGQMQLGLLSTFFGINIYFIFIVIYARQLEKDTGKYSANVSEKASNQQSNKMSVSYYYFK